jgi:predicted nuclease with TOPRIM domain
MQAARDLEIADLQKQLNERSNQSVESIEKFKELEKKIENLNSEHRREVAQLIAERDRERSRRETVESENATLTAKVTKLQTDFDELSARFDELKGQVNVISNGHTGDTDKLNPDNLPIAS